MLDVESMACQDITRLHSRGIPYHPTLEHIGCKILLSVAIIGCFSKIPCNSPRSQLLTVPAHVYPVSRQTLSVAGDYDSRNLYVCTGHDAERSENPDPHIVNTVLTTE